ncbi:MAG: Ig-like domain-containing protein, partial [Thermoplasmata archaeon]
ITSPAAKSVIPSSEVKVTWQAQDATSGIDHYEVLFLGGDSVAVPATSTGYTFSGVEDGPHSIAIVAVDRAGNSQSQTVDFTVDTSAFSPTGPFGILLIVVIPVAAGGAVAASLFLWFRKRDSGGA